MGDMEIRKNIRKINVEELKALIDGEPFYNQPSGSTLTVCHLKTKCGIILTGNSGCLNPDDFNAELGKKIAYDNAFNQLWQLEGYARLRVLVDGLDKATVVKSDYPPHVNRMVYEEKELVERAYKLNTFTNTDTFRGLSEEEQGFVLTQLKQMNDYAQTLGKRLGAMGIKDGDVK